MFFCWCALECYKIIPVTILMNVSRSCHSNLTLYLPELEVRRFNYLMSPLPSYLSLWRVKLDCLDSNLPVEMKHREDAVRRQWVFLVDWLLNSKYKFVRFYNLPSADIRCWKRLKKSHSPQTLRIYWKRLCSDLPLGRRVSPGVHAGPVGAGEAEGVAHASWSRRGRFGPDSRFRGTEVTIGYLEFVLNPIKSLNWHLINWLVKWCT